MKSPSVKWFEWSKSEFFVPALFSVSLRSTKNRAVWPSNLPFIIPIYTKIFTLLILKAQGFYDVKAPKSTAAKAYADKPTHVHHTWHVDIAYVKIQEVYYYLIVMIDGYSRYVLDWELLFDMKGDTVSLFAQKVLDQYPRAVELKVRIVSDNGSCFVSSEYRLVLKQNSIIPIRCAPYHPQTNGKAEAVIKITRNEALRPNSPQFYQEAINVLKKHFDFYNNHRLYSGIDYVRPVDMFLGRADQVLQQRKEGLYKAKLERKTWNQNYNETKIYNQNPPKYESHFCSV